MTVLYFLDVAGTFAFALSGVMCAITRKFDIFGALVIGAVCAVGGGSMRDCLLGVGPVAWMTDPVYMYVIILAVIIAIVFKTFVMRLRKTLFLFDTIGIGVFTAIGVSKAISMEVPIPGAVMMGITSAVVGGVIRDVLCNEIPLIFHKEIYAVACMFGAIIYVVLHHFHLDDGVNMAITASSIIVVRIFAVHFNLKLPTFDDAE